MNTIEQKKIQKSPLPDIRCLIGWLIGFGCCHRYFLSHPFQSKILQIPVFFTPFTQFDFNTTDPFTYLFANETFSIEIS